jgi:hypothetical protein
LVTPQAICTNCHKKKLDIKVVRWWVVGFVGLTKQDYKPPWVVNVLGPFGDVSE